MKKNTRTFRKLLDGMMRITRIHISFLIQTIIKNDHRLVVKNHSVKSFFQPLLFLFIFLCTISVIRAQTAEDLSQKGLEAFKWQKPEEASVFFQQATEVDPEQDMYFLYLGMSYHLSGKLEEAEHAYTRGIQLNGSVHDRLVLNRGNLRTVLNNYDGALSDYSKVTDTHGPLSSAAVLNRANVELNQSSFSLALDDYSTYLVLEPRTPQRERIEELIGLLRNRLASDAVLAEKVRLEKERLLVAEAARAEEEARRASLIEEALHSLGNSGDDTRSISAGSEDIHEDFEDSALED